MAAQTVDLVVVGSIALDSVETPFGHVDSGLGGSASFFSLSAWQFCRVGVVGVVGDDFPEAHRRLFAERNVDLAGFEQAAGETFRWSGKYGYDLNVATTLDTKLNVFAHFRPALPEHYRRAPFLFLGNIDPELQLAVLEQAEHLTLVACDTMNFWIERKADALRRTLERVDAVLINDAEARQLSGEWNIVRAIACIHRMGPKVVVIKRGEYGAFMSTEAGYFLTPAFPLEDVRDPTGAGDSFAGGFMGYLARRGEVTVATLRQALMAGSIMASFSVESFGTKRLESLDKSDIRERARHFKSLTDLEPIEALV